MFSKYYFTVKFNAPLSKFFFFSKDPNQKRKILKELGCFQVALAGKLGLFDDLSTLVQ